MKTKKAFLIDPKAMTVTEVQHTVKLATIYESLGCRVFQGLPLERRSSVYIDEEGRLKNEGTAEFLITGDRGVVWPIIGKGLVVGPPDDDGVETDAPFTLEEITSRVTFFAEIEL